MEGDDLMLVGIVADVYRDDRGTFICEVITNEIDDGLDEALSNFYGCMTLDEVSEDEQKDVTDAEAILEFLRGPLGDSVTWWVR